MLDLIMSRIGNPCTLIRRYSSKRHSSFLDNQMKFSHCYVEATATALGTDLGPFQISMMQPLHRKFSYAEVLWSAFSRIRTEYGEIRSISLYSVRMRKNADQNNSEYVHFSRSEPFAKKTHHRCLKRS